MAWFDKCLSIFVKSFDEIPQSVIEETRNCLARLQSVNPVVSIVVIGYNEGTYLRACLWHLILRNMGELFNRTGPIASYAAVFYIIEIEK